MKKLLIFIFSLLSVPMSAQIHADVEMQASVSNDRTPLWLNANKYGLSSLNANNGYVRATLTRDLEQPKSKHWDWGFGADVALPVGYVSESACGRYTTNYIVQQLYADVRYRRFVLTIGAKQQPMQLHDNRLSSGAQTLGRNARPVPQVRLGLDDWWTVPGVNGWLQAMAHASFGVMTDGAWEEKFANGGQYIYNKLTRYHEKAGYLRIGKQSRFPLTFVFGLEMAAQFGGDLYNWKGTDQSDYASDYHMRLKSDLKSYWNAFMPGGGDTGETSFQNSEGNQLGSWIFRFDWTRPDYAIGLYADHFFEDHSSMFLLDYDGYGEGENWQQKEEWRYFLYKLNDLQLGLDLKLNKGRWLKRALVEFINTKYQSGPIYHDRNSGNSDHLGGIDDYYNHSTLPGWQHWGQVIGNPLYRSPLYNCADGYISSTDNRFTAWHFGAEGCLGFDALTYRVLYTWQKGFGTYRSPFVRPEVSNSYLAELSYRLADFTFVVGVASDFGKIYGDNTGAQFTLKYHIR
ncbi:MAG: hypothetical protein KBT20_02465 [Bacteroidales bacterium]|nr:hypothetical protein [Candidatus Liminaster caballi]